MPYYMYVSSQGADKIVRFTMDPATGDLEAQGEVAVPGGPAAIAVDPSRRFLYVAKRGERKTSELKGASQSMEKSMSEKELHDLASTRQKGKPAHATKS